MPHIHSFMATAMSHTTKYILHDIWDDNFLTWNCLDHKGEWCFVVILLCWLLRYDDAIFLSDIIWCIARMPYFLNDTSRPITSKTLPSTTSNYNSLWSHNLVWSYDFWNRDPSRLSDMDSPYRHRSNSTFCSLITELKYHVVLRQAGLYAIRCIDPWACSYTQLVSLYCCLSLAPPILPHYSKNGLLWWSKLVGKTIK